VHRAFERWSPPEVAIPDNRVAPGRERVSEASRRWSGAVEGGAAGRAGGASAPLRVLGASRRWIVPARVACLCVIA
jgi:hypothetical protein